MKILSIRQPWTTLIATGKKKIENRNWATEYRGPVLLHAGLKREYTNPGVIEYCRERGVRLNDSYETGGIVGIAELVDCVEASDDPWFNGLYGFVFRKARALDFIPAKGRLGLYQPDDELLAKLKL